MTLWHSFQVLSFWGAYTPTLVSLAVAGVVVLVVIIVNRL